MMTTVPRYIKLTVPPFGIGNRITVIKAIRVLTGLGLKESKDIMEKEGEHLIRVVGGIGTNYETGATISAILVYQNAVADLKINGVKVTENSVRNDLLEELRKLVAHAVVNDDIELAASLFDTLKKYS